MSSKISPLEKAVKDGLSLITMVHFIDEVIIQPNGKTLRTGRRVPGMTGGEQDLFMLVKEVGNKLYPKAAIKVRRRRFVERKSQGEKGGMLGWNEDGSIETLFVIETKTLWAMPGYGPSIHDCMLYFYGSYFGEHCISIADRSSVSDAAGVLRKKYVLNRSDEINFMPLDNYKVQFTPTKTDDVSATHAAMGGYTFKKVRGKTKPELVEDAYKDIGIQMSQNGLRKNKKAFEQLTFNRDMLIQKYPQIMTSRGVKIFDTADTDAFYFWYEYALTIEAKAPADINVPIEETDQVYIELKNGKIELYTSFGKRF